MGEGVDDTLRGIGISARDRLEHIEAALTRIDAKLDTRFDSVEGRLSAVESTQAGQASIAEFAANAKSLADETSEKAAGLADEATKKAAGLADKATEKAAGLAEELKKFDLALIDITRKIGEQQERQDKFDRKVSWFGGLGAAFVFAAGVIGYYI